MTFLSADMGSGTEKALGDILTTIPSGYSIFFVDALRLFYG